MKILRKYSMPDEYEMLHLSDEAEYPDEVIKKIRTMDETVKALRQAIKEPFPDRVGELPTTGTDKLKEKI